MAFNAGAIYYTVEAKYDALLNAEKKVSDSMDNMSDSMGKADKSSEKLNTSMTKTAEGVKKAAREADGAASSWSSLTKIVTAYMSLKLVQQIAALSDQYGQYASRIKNATANTAEYEMVQDRLLATANGTYRSLNEAQEVYLSVADTLRDLGYTTNDVLDITDSFSYALVRDAARADQAQTAMDAYSKALMKGKIEADGWASILAATPSIVDAIAKATGRTSTEIRNLGATSKLSVTALNEGLILAREENMRLAEEMEVSTKDATIQLANAFQVFFGKANAAAGVSKVFTDNVGELAKTLQDPATIQAATDLATGIVSALNTIINAIKDTVGMARWLGEELAARFNGIAVDDVERWQEKVDGYTETLTRMQENGDTNTVYYDKLVKRLDEANKGLEKAIKYQSTIQSMTSQGGTAPAPSTTPGTRPTVDAENNTGAAERAAAKAEKALQKRIDAIQLEADTLDMTATELELYKLQLAGATDEQIRAAATSLALIESYRQQEAAAKAATKAEEDRKKKFGTTAKSASEYIRGDVDPLSGGAFDNQYARYEAEGEEEKKRYADQLERLRQAQADKIEVMGGYQALEQQMAKEHADRMAQIEQAKNSTILASGQEMFGALADAAEAYAGDSSSAYKALFAVSKAFALADAGLRLQSAIAQAMADPTALTPAQKFANMAAVASAGGSVLTQIASIGFGGGRRYGGDVDPSKMYRINENGAPEVFNAANGQQYMLPNKRGQVASNADATGGAGIFNYIDISVDGAGNSKVSDNGGSADSRSLATAIKVVVVDELERQSRPGGLLWQMRQNNNG